MLEIVFHHRAEKELLKIPKERRLQILDKISMLKNLSHPLQVQNVIKLQARKAENFRLRVGDYRVKFSLREKTIFITEIQHRQAGY